MNGEMAEVGNRRTTPDGNGSSGVGYVRTRLLGRTVGELPIHFVRVEWCEPIATGPKNNGTGRRVMEHLITHRYRYGLGLMTSGWAVAWLVNYVGH